MIAGGLYKGMFFFGQNGYILAQNILMVTPDKTVDRLE